MIIETKKDFLKFLTYYVEHLRNVIFIPILTDNKRHPANNQLSFLFIKPIDLNKWYNEWYILPFNHNDCMKLELSCLNDLNTDNNKFTLDKKGLLHTFQFNNVIDINLLEYLNTNKTVIIESETYMPPIQRHIQSKFSNIKNINKSVPILKYVECLLLLSNKLEESIKNNIHILNDESFKFLNETTINALFNIEKNGLTTNRDSIEKYFPSSKIHISPNNKLYTEYNIYTTTGRPSNRFGNINFSGLNATTGEREIVCSANGMLSMFDYDAYHIRLIAEIVGYEFPKNTSVHEYLAKLYTGKEVVNDYEYSESKKITFNILYGGIDKSIADSIPFFNNVNNYIEEQWEKLNSVGYVETLISKKKIKLENFIDLNKNKMFNYMFQNYETEKNILVIDSINSYLSGKSSKLILYLYDSFLFDIDSSELNIINELETIINCDNRFPTRLYTGNDFNNMVKVQ